MHERLSIHCMCFAGASLQALANGWRELGARRVSLASAQVLTEELSTIRDLLTAGDHRLETITHPFLGARPLEPKEDSWREARATLTQLIHAADQLGARSIYMLSGGHGTLTWEQAADVFATAIAPCVTQARNAGIELMVENSPALYPDIHIAHTLRDTITLAETAGIGICMDVYSCWTEAGLRESIERAIPRCHLVQLSDYVLGDRALPSRAVPGDGAIPLERFVAWVLAAGYRGIFELEILGPRIDREGHLAATRRACDRVTELLSALISR